MGTKLLSRLDRAITCINAHDSDKVFDKKLMEVKLYAQFLNNGDRVLREVIQITKKTLSKTKHSVKEKEQILNQLHSIQEKIRKELYNCLS